MTATSPVPGPHTVVVGAGIVGMCCAWHLRSRGEAVTVIDRLEPGMGCSFGNIGGVAVTEVAPMSIPGLLMKVPGWLMDPLGPLTVRWSYLPKLAPWLIRFLAAGRAKEAERIAAAAATLFRHVAGDFGSILRETGAPELLGTESCVAVYDTQAEFDADTWAYDLRARNGFPCTPVSGAELVELEPDLAPDFAGGRIYQGWYNVTDPYRVVTTIAEDFVRQGGEIHQADVTDIVREGHQVASLRCADGSAIACDRLVIAGGAWSHRLARLLGDTVSLETERGYHTTIADPGVSPSREVVYGPQGFGLSPMDGGLRIGGSVELAGLDTPPNYARARVLVKKAKRVYPGLARTEGAEWMGHRPATPDSLPIIGRAPLYANAFYAFGHGHVGLTLGPTTGRLIADLVLEGQTDVDLAPFAADRF